MSDYELEQLLQAELAAGIIIFILGIRAIIKFSTTLESILKEEKNVKKLKNTKII